MPQSICAPRNFVWQSHLCVIQDKQCSAICKAQAEVLQYWYFFLTYILLSSLTCRLCYFRVCSRVVISFLRFSGRFEKSCPCTHTRPIVLPNLAQNVISESSNFLLELKVTCSAHMILLMKGLCKCWGYKRYSAFTHILMEMLFQWSGVWRNGHFRPNIRQNIFENQIVTISVERVRLWKPMRPKRL